MPGIVPVNPVERRTAEQVQAKANEVIGGAVTELRRADQVHAISNQLIELMVGELKDYRTGSEAHTMLADALASLGNAERLIRLRGEINGR
jgi:hypothetical protein